MLEQEEINPALNKVNYKYAGKESLGETIRKAFPEQLIPTKRINVIFGLIFLAAIIISGMQFPFNQMLSGNLDISINLGYPWHFLEFYLSDIEKSPILLVNLFLDLMLYLILAYAIDIILNLILKNSILKSEEEIEQHPTVFKDQKPTIADKVVEKQNK